ncbi:MAG: aspartate kinase [Desulfurococcales archaeon]|nr:aspartate kinase [Desulfurococcales archaeon]
MGGKSNKVLVVKFGGSVLSSPEDYLRASDIVRDLLGEGWRVVVVVSAMKGVTDTLLEITYSPRESAGELLGRIAEMHRKVLAGSLDTPYFEKYYLDLSKLLNELAKTVWAIEVLGEVTPRIRDFIVSFGEKLSALIMSSVLEYRGVKSRWLTGGDAGIVTDESYGEAKPLMPETIYRVRDSLYPLLDSGITPVVTGFIGRSMRGNTTTLGRGGSDYSAALIASALEAVEVRFYTNVEGVLSANPSIFPEASTIKKLAIEEAMELSYLGAKRFHPRTFEPLKNSASIARILSFYNPHGPNTVVHGTCDGDNGVKAIIVDDDIAIVNVEGPTMVGRIGTAAEVMSLAWKAGVNIRAISQPISETVITLVLSRSDGDKLASMVEEELKPRGIVENVEVLNDAAAVAVVGCGLSKPEVQGRILDIVKGVEVYGLLRGLRGSSMTIITKPDTALEVARRIHQEVVMGG